MRVTETERERMIGQTDRHGTDEHACDAHTHGRSTYNGVHTKDYADGLNLFDPAVDGDFVGDGAGAATGDPALGGAGVEEEVGAGGGGGGGAEGVIASGGGGGGAEGVIASHEEQRISTMMILRPCRNLTHHALVVMVLLPFVPTLSRVT